jgi:hypothetical protein
MCVCLLIINFHVVASISIKFGIKLEEHLRDGFHHKGLPEISPVDFGTLKIQNVAHCS